MRQGDTISPKLFTASLESIFRKSDWQGMGINIDINHVYFTNLKIYDAVQLDFKTEDRKLTIVGISGNIDYTGNIEECYEKKDQIVKEISNIFKDAEKESSSGNHPGYPDGKVTFKRTSFLSCFFN